MERIVSRYDGGRKGPLLLVLGGMHGNEPAGLEAVRYVQKMLEVEPIKNEQFWYAGTFVGMIGNIKATKLKERFIDRDLNRSWTKDNVDRIMSYEKSMLENEDWELRDMLDSIRALIQELEPERVIVLDLHTTSSYGGIFSIPTEDSESIRIAKELHAPVIRGMLKGLQGTTLHYLNTENMGIDTTTIVFESGQHEEPKAVNRAIAAIINCMRSVGAVDPEIVENIHDNILIEYSKPLPKVVDILSKYEIKHSGSFVMNPGYNNFQSVKAGEHLAVDGSEDVFCETDALILMPLYQRRGNDGFFLVKEIKK